MSTAASPRKPGRPSSAQHGTFAGANLDRPDWALGWSDGEFSGNPVAVREAALLCELAVPVPLTATGPDVPADADDPVIAWAVMNRVLRHRVHWTGDVPTLTDSALDNDDDALLSSDELTEAVVR